jgi:hypothetical protein
METKEKKSNPWIILLSILLILSILMNIGGYVEKNLERRQLNDHICHLLYHAIRNIEAYFDFDHPATLSSIEMAGLYLKELYFTFASNSNGISPVNATELSVVGGYLLLHHDLYRNSILSNGIISESDEEFLRQLSVILSKLLTQFKLEDNLNKDSQIMKSKNLTYEQINSILYEFELDFYSNAFLVQSTRGQGIWQQSEFDYESEWYLDATSKPNQGAGGGGAGRQRLD